MIRYGKFFSAIGWRESSEAWMWVAIWTAYFAVAFGFGLWAFR